jgi:hypothetical protein
MPPLVHPAVVPAEDKIEILIVCLKVPMSRDQVIGLVPQAGEAVGHGLIVPERFDEFGVEQLRGCGPLHSRLDNGMPLRAVLQRALQANGTIAAKDLQEWN